MSIHRAAAWLLLGVSAFFGCGGCSGGKSGGDPNGRPVTGVVKYQGNPVEGATVTFQAPSNSAFGMTDAEGKFTLTTGSGDRVPLGQYEISIVKKEAPPAPPPEPASDEDYVPPDPNAPPPPEPKDLLPVKYSDPKKSELTETVTADGPNEFTFELTD